MKKRWFLDKLPLPTILNNDNVKQNIFLLLFFLTVSCNTDKDNFFVQTEDQYKTIDGKKQIVSQTLKTLRVSDSLPMTILSKISNFNNDTRLHYLTGLTKEDGLQNYLLDSLFYDNFGNDTLKKSYIYFSKKWQPIQFSYKKFRSDRNISYFMTERSFNNDHYFKKEIFYTYNLKGKVLTETEVECQQKTNCDSISKKLYIYNLTGKLDSTVLFIWKNNEWIELKRKSSR